MVALALGLALLIIAYLKEGGGVVLSSVLWKFMGGLETRA